VKRYPSGIVSQYLHRLSVGEEVGFKHIKFNVKEQYPFEGKNTISMVCGGTGLTPMYQALLKLLNTPGDERQVVLLYGSKSPDDILMKEQLDAWASKHANRFKLVHVLGGRSSRYTHGHSKQRSCRRTLTTLRQPGRTRAPLALSKADGSTRCAQCRDPPSALLAVTSGKSARWCQPLGACDGDISCFAMLLPEQVRGAVVGLSQRSAAIQPYGSV